MKILDKHVIGEALQILVIGTLGILGVFFGTIEFSHVLQLLNQFGLPPSAVLSVMLLQLPTGMTYCMPAGVMIAALLCMGRQQHDSEIIALQVSGISMRRIIAPYVALGMLGALCSFLVGEFVAPQTTLLSEKLVMLGIFNAERPFVGQTKIEFKDKNDKVEQLMLMGNGVGRSVNGFILLDVSQKNQINMIWAEQAQWADGKWRLIKGRMFDLLREDTAGDRGRFQKMSLGNNSFLFETINGGAFLTTQKTTKQLHDEIVACEKQGKTAPPHIRMQYYRRFSHPLSCVFLVIATIPLMIPKRRRGTTLAMAYGGLLVVLYFVLQQLCVSLSDNLRLDPIAAAWLPGTVLCLLGLTVTLCQRRR